MSELPAPLPTPDDRVKSVKQLVDFASELQDTEVVALAKIVAGVSHKYSTQRATAKNLENLRDEMLTRLADIGILATVDVAPVLSGEPPTVEIIGRVGGSNEAMDHERKEHQVKKATKRGEQFLGEKEASGE